ncbi:MAG: ABC transporter ATP-binding protein [Erysipelotrichales bacterium]|nr:ABC transporter ATP-binding protein [Erysipelotrichales bacterium]
MAKIYEDKVVTSNTKNMLGRLYEFMRAYVGKMLFALVLVLTVTLLDLFRPVLIGNAIDTYIEGYTTPYAVLEEATKNSIEFDGVIYVKQDVSDEHDTYARLVLQGDIYYFFTDLDVKDLETITNAEDNQGFTLDGSTLSVGNLKGKAMSKDELNILRKGDINSLVKAGLLYLVVLVSLFICNLSQTWILQLSGQNIIYEIRMKLFKKLHFLPLRYFDTHPVGQLVTRVTNDVESLHEMYANILVRLFRNVAKIIGLAAVMLSIDTTLAVYAFGTLPFIAIFTVVFRTISRRMYRIMRVKISALNTFLSENISGMKLIQIFAKEDYKFDEFKGRTTDLYNTSLKEMYVFAIFRPLIYMLSVIALSIILYNGSLRVLSNAITIGTLYIFINYINSFFEPIQEIAEQFSTLQNAIASAEKIFTVLDEENPIEQKEDAIVLKNVEGRIEFKNVWFAYEDDNYVLKDVSFTIEPGQTVAFVGATGAGKSSILNLIGRYYDIQKGQILVDGIDIKDLNIHSLRRAIGQVQQDVFVFTGNMYSNIRLRKEDISDVQVMEAAKFVNANYFIERLPNQYNEEVSERGATLSSGQRQLLSFARTLAYDPKILVMDEATANIDTETEQLIQDGLESLMKGRTTIMVAHRLSTIQHADNIIVMHKGQIREMGKHQELLAQNGIYKKLYELQLRSN